MKKKTNRPEKNLSEPMPTTIEEAEVSLREGNNGFRAVRQEIELLRNADEEKLRQLGDEKCRNRVQWFKNHYVKTMNPSGSLLDDAYRMFLTKLGITEAEAPVVERTADALVIRSTNFCPTLEACRILNLDTRVVCRLLTENATTELLRQLHPGLRFSRNYEKLRPYAAYCEEMMVIDHKSGSCKGEEYGDENYPQREHQIG